MTYSVIIEAFYVAGPLGILVFAILIVLSIVSWGLIFATAVYFRRLHKEDKDFLEQFESADRPADLYKNKLSEEGSDVKSTGVKAIFKEIYREVVNIEDHVAGLNFVDAKMQTIKSNFDEIIGRTLQKAKNKENTKRERYFSFFATTSNVAPFLGLLGTVIGIIDAFAEIGRVGSADLQFVAPAISEALVATALGLFVAIPASVAFNYFRARSHEFRQTFDIFTIDLLNRIQQHYFFKDNG